MGLSTEYQYFLVAATLSAGETKQSKTKQNLDFIYFFRSLSRH